MGHAAHFRVTRFFTATCWVEVISESGWFARLPSWSGATNTNTWLGRARKNTSFGVAPAVR